MRLGTSRITGTSKPASVSTAMPMWMLLSVTIRSPSQRGIQQRVSSGGPAPSSLMTMSV